MVDRIRGQTRTDQRGEGGLGSASVSGQEDAGPSFSQVLQAQAGYGPRFSAHAQRRLAERAIQLDQWDLARLDQAIDRASAKGGRESLILLEDLAFVVSVKNRTVITAVDGEQARDNVFTNVDSVVIAR